MTLDEIKQEYVGKVGESVLLEVEAGAIKQFAAAVDDYNPLYCDGDYARSSKYGTIIAPPGFFGWPVKFIPGRAPMLAQLFQDLTKDLREAGYPVLLDGGIELESFVPVRAGDILMCIPVIKSITKRETKAGKTMVISIGERDYVNQNGTLATRSSQTLINMTA